tara:strand:- start:111 stop:737 length:627 start_codon:yes stop_codon:yes gene_type:complete
MAIVINGSGTLSGLAVGGLPDGTVDSGTIATGTIVNADINDLAASKLTGALPAISGASLTGFTDAQMPAGSVLQVVQVTSNSQTDPNTSWTAIQGASVVITPSSSSSKILISFNVGGMTNGTPDNISLKMLRGSTSIRVSSRYAYSTGSGWFPVPLFFTYLDSPSTTSSTEYTIQTKTDVDNDYRINDDQENNGGVNGLVIIATEIAG